MATRSRIGMEQADGSVKSIYCHNNGYPDYNGLVLDEFYTDPEKVKKLIELGDISSLDSEIDGGENHTYESPQKGQTVAYHRDRGEELNEPRVDGSVQEFFNGDIEEYGYLFTQEGQWLVKASNDSHQPMTVEDYLTVTNQ